MAALEQYRRRRPGRVSFALLLVVALHMAVIVSLSRSGTASRGPAVPARVTLRIIPLVRPPAPVLPFAAPARQAPAQPVRIPPARPSVTAARIPVPAPSPLEPRIDPDDERRAAPLRSATITPAPPAASAPLAGPALLDTEASRRAIHSAARAPSLGDQLARSREEPQRVSAGDRLASGVKEAGKGDCVKGEYPGAGMGLLSVPFLAAAMATGNCSK